MKIKRFLQNEKKNQSNLHLTIIGLKTEKNIIEVCQVHTSSVFIIGKGRPALLEDLDRQRKRKTAIRVLSIGGRFKIEDHDWTTLRDEERSASAHYAVSCHGASRRIREGSVLAMRYFIFLYTSMAVIVNKQNIEH